MRAEASSDAEVVGVLAENTFVDLIEDAGDGWQQASRRGRKMQLRENAKYDIATVSSMGIRITPVNRMPVATSHLFEMQSTSAETNVLNVTSSLGGSAVVLTKFVKESAIAQFIKNELRARNISFIAQEVDAGGAWGYRHQINR